MGSFWPGMGGFFIWVLFWIGISALIWHGRGGRSYRHRHGFSEQTPLDILKTRYAKGEIDKQEFEEKKKDLN